MKKLTAKETDLLEMIRTAENPEKAHDIAMQTIIQFIEKYCK